MHARLASVLLIGSAVILSFVSFIAGEVVVPFYGVEYRPKSLAELRELVPAPTLFISDHRFLVIMLLAGMCFFSLVAVWRLPGQTFRCLAAGLCAQWLAVWATAFCLCYDGFLGSVSMHHPQWFEFDQFLTCARGVFPVSLFLIVAPLVTALWPVRPSSDA